MNITINSDNLIVALLAAIGLYAIMLWLWRRAYPSKPSSTSTSQPTVVVNVPAEFKPMAGLPPTEIEGARAVLFYSVYSKAVDAFTGDGAWTLDSDDESEAYTSANRAVEAVFGPIKP